MTVSLAVGFSLFGDMAIYVILPVHYAELGLSALQVGILLSANRWVRLVTNRLAERLLRRFSSAVLFPAALLVGSVLAAAYSTAPAFIVLLVIRMIWGLCWSFIRHTGVMTSIGIADTRNTGSRIGIYIGILQAGFVAGIFVSGLLFDVTGFQITFLLVSAMSLAAIPTALIANRHTRVNLKEPSTSKSLPDRGMLLLEVRGFIVSLIIGVTSVNGALLAARYLIDGVGSPFFGMAIDMGLDEYR